MVEVKTRAERRREEKAKRKLKEQFGKEFRNISDENIDKFFNEQATAEVMLQEAMRKFEDDCANRYNALRVELEKKYRERFNALDRQAVDTIAAEEDRIRKDYDKRMRRPKVEIIREVKGELMAMTFWVLRDYFDFQPDDLHKFNLQMIRLDASMKEREKLGSITINDIINQMKKEGFDIVKDTDLVDEMVDAEMERFHRPYSPKGTVFNLWVEADDERMKRLIKDEYDYEVLSMILGRTESACKSRARKLFGTSELKRIREYLGGRNDG